MLAFTGGVFPGVCRGLGVSEGVRIENLRCEMLVDPEGIDALQPRLSWEISSGGRGVEQSAYRVLVASSPEKLEAGEGDLWDSGKVESDQSAHVSYAGVPLKSRMRCFWMVRVWTAKDESSRQPDVQWSPPAYWSMGLLHYNDWNGRWIGLDRAFPWDSEGKFSRLSARYFRKEFEGGKEIQRATVYIIGLGLYELYVNGKKIGDQVLAPTPTDYTQNVKYNAFDVTENLKSEGENAVGVILGNGRYFAMRHYKPYKIKTFGYPKMLLQLEIEYAGGKRRIIKTDDTWKVTPDGPIRSNNEYDGEEYDARKEMPGWDRPGFDDSDWSQAEYVQEPGGDFQAQLNENMKVMKELSPVSITRLPEDKYILDMGQNMVGWLQLRVKGERGRQVQLRFAESLQDNGELFMANLRDAKVTDTYILKGEGVEIWEPKFVYHGFRYVEVTGYPGTPSTADFTGRMVYDDMKTVGTFETSDTTLNQIYQNAWWGIAGNYKGMPVDCPQRNERQPWLGDRATGAYGESFMFDNGKLYAKWMDDIRYAQKADGSIPDVAPAFWRYYSDNMTWPGTFILVADMLYRQHGDLTGIERHYPAMKKWLRYMKDRYMTDAFIVTKDSYGDWCAPPPSIEAGRGISANKKHPSALISTAYYYHFMQIMMRFAELSDQEKDYRQFETLGKQVKEAFHNRFYNPEKGCYGDSTLTSNLLPLYFGMIPVQYEEQVFNHIVETIEVKNGGHLSTGLIGTQWLMRSLTRFGTPGLAYTVASQRTYPSWGYMIENGATTIWELWNGNTAAPDMNSQNHVMMLGDLIVWYYEHLAGIKTDPERPGFKRILMRPEPVEGLDFVKASYHSMHGLVRSEWERKGDRFTWKVTVPGNTRALVYVPAGSEEAVTEGDGRAVVAEGVEFAGTEDGRAVFEIGSGTYEFNSILNHETK